MWTKTWPTAPGFYWFYGVLHSQQSKRQVYFVQGTPSPDGNRLATCGIVLRSIEGCTGQWTEAILPTLPEN